VNDKVADDQTTFLRKVKDINSVYHRVVLTYILAVVFFIIMILMRDWSNLFILFLFVIAGLAVHVSLFKCPNCGRYFFFRVLFISRLA